MISFNDHNSMVRSMNLSTVLWRKNLNVKRESHLLGGRVSFMNTQFQNHLSLCSTIALLKFLITFKQRELNFTLCLINNILGPACRSRD